MPNEYDWIPKSFSNLGEALGLNPKAAAEGRRLQAGADYDEARTRNVDAETTLIPLKGEVYKSQAGANKSQAGASDAQAGKLNAEKALVEMAAKGRQGLADLMATGAFVQNPDGSVTISAKAANSFASNLALMESDPSRLMPGIREVTAMASNPRNAALTRGISGATEPDASFSAAEGEKIQATKEAAENERTKMREQGALARTIAAGGGASGQGGATPEAARAARLESDIDGAIDEFQPNMDQEWKAYIREEAAKLISGTVTPKTAVRQVVASMGATSWNDDKWMGESYSPRSAQTSDRMSPAAWRARHTSSAPTPGSPSPGSPNPAPAPTAGAAGTVAQTIAPAPAQPPAQAIQPPPADARQRITGQVYQTNAGPMKWTGTGWVNP